MAKTYTHESVQRALLAHQTSGLIRDISPPEPAGGRKTYRINLRDYGWWEGSLRDTFNLVVGLRVGSLSDTIANTATGAEKEPVT